MAIIQIDKNTAIFDDVINTINDLVTGINDLTSFDSITITNSSISTTSIENSIIGAVTPAAATFSNTTVNSTLTTDTLVFTNVVANDVPGAQAAFGLTIGSDVQAYSTKLSNLSTLSDSSGTIEKTGASTYDVYTVTTFAKSMLDDTTAVATRATLGLGSISTLSTIAATNISSNAVTEAKIADGAVTESKLASNAVTEGKIASGAVTVTKIPDNTITPVKITIDGVQEIRAVPQLSKSSAYTTVASDAGKHILHPSGDTTARTWTIPSNASVAYPIGTAITFINQNAAGVITISITSDTMRLADKGTTGNRSLKANGIATAIKIASTEWIISGAGLS